VSNGSKTCDFNTKSGSYQHDLTIFRRHAHAQKAVRIEMAVKKQKEMQKQLQRQLLIQRNLQQSLEAHGKYLQNIMGASLLPPTSSAPSFSLFRFHQLSTLMLRSVFGWVS
jgi:hypothetical protein